MKSKKKKKKIEKNHFYKISRLFGVLPNFPFTAIETIHLMSCQTTKDLRSQEIRNYQKSV